MKGWEKQAFLLLLVGTATLFSTRRFWGEAPPLPQNLHHPLHCSIQQLQGHQEKSSYPSLEWDVQERLLFLQEENFWDFSWSRERGYYLTHPVECSSEGLVLLLNNLSFAPSVLHITQEKRLEGWVWVCHKIDQHLSPEDIAPYGNDFDEETA